MPAANSCTLLAMHCSLWLAGEERQRAPASLDPGPRIALLTVDFSLAAPAFQVQAARKASSAAKHTEGGHGVQRHFLDGL